MYQECSMRVTKVADSPIFCDNTENAKLFMKKNVVNKNTVRKHYSCWWVRYLRIPILPIKFSLKLKPNSNSTLDQKKQTQLSTKFAQKERFCLKKQVNTPIEFCIFFWFSRPNLPKKVISDRKLKKLAPLLNSAYSNYSWYQISAYTDNFDFGPNLPKKRYFWSKTEKVNITIEFWIFKLV